MEAQFSCLSGNHRAMQAIGIETVSAISSLDEELVRASKFRILNCIASLGGGGAERQLSHVAAELKKTGMDVHVAYLRPGTNLDSMRDSGVTFHQLYGRNNYDPRILRQLVKTIRSVKPDLIQTWLLQMDIIAGLAARLTDTPFILSEQASALAYSGSWKERLRTWIGRRATMIVANSETGKEYWCSRKEARRIVVIRNGLPLEQIRQVPESLFSEFGIDASKEVILFAGRYEPQKNVLTMLEAFRQVLLERHKAVALLFGQGPLEREMVETVRRHGLEGRVKILGYTTELWGGMKRANLFVNVSVFEGSPNVVCEAAALRCPMVLSNIPEHRELLDDKSATFVSPHSPSDIARGIVQVLQNPNLARKKAAAAYEMASKHSIESVVPAYLELYRQALAG